eukprot:jgi/Picsp_1/4545/NSC_06766-R1_leucine carboxyl methyltransferase
MRRSKENFLDSDAGVKVTNHDAQLSKMSCVRKGYFVDDFVHHFVGNSFLRSRIMPPIINRGYYARHAIIKSQLLNFINIHKDRKDTPQVLILGCGFDTLYFQLRKEGLVDSSVHYVECDFQDVVEAKGQILKDKISSTLYKGFHSMMDGFTSAGTYRLVGADLRDTGQLHAGLIQAGMNWEMPTFILAECVLVYMDTEESLSLLKWISSMFSEANMLIYEQVNPHDPFGRQMMANLDARGCPLKGIISSLDDHKKRMYESGWDFAECEYMLDMFNKYIPQAEVHRINQIEMLDEQEEWNLLLRHYCITIASKRKKI